MNMITKKEVILLTLIPGLVFSLMDLGTTYYGVCVNHGIELNINAINLAQRFGFLPAGFIYICERLIIGLFLSYILWKCRVNEIARTFVLIVIVLYLTNFANVIVLNINALMYQETGSGFAPPDSHEKDMTPSQIQEVKDTFVAKDFCRLI